MNRFLAIALVLGAAGCTSVLIPRVEHGPPGDADDDGVADEADRCGGEPEDADHVDDADGCPEPG